MHYIKAYAKGVLKTILSMYKFQTQIYFINYTLKVIDSTEKLSSKIHLNNFTFAYCLISVSLYTVFKVLAFRSLCFRNKIDFALTWPTCTRNLLSKNQSHKLEKSISSCFSISITSLCCKTMQISSV